MTDSEIGARQRTKEIKAKHAELTTLLKQPKSAANETQIQSVVDGMLDYDALAQRSLSKHWDSLSEAQRNEFRSVLTQLVRRAYRRDLRKTLNYQVTRNVTIRTGFSSNVFGDDDLNTSIGRLMFVYGWNPADEKVYRIMGSH